MSSTDTVNPARRVADAIGPSVVRVGRHGGRGGGLVIESGAVVTNAHNLRGPEITVTFADGRRETGTVDTGDAPVPDWGAGADLGDTVFAVSALSEGGVRVTAGAISATDRTFRG